MPLNPLNHHYSMENPASVYDEEAMTALQLAARTTAKVNEAVEAFNELETNTNAHLSEQDNNIKTMNEVTMPANVAAEVQRKIDSGEFADEIDKYAGNLERRVDNLLGVIAPGSTTSAMDAEIIDARLGVIGDSTETNLGNSIRKQAEVLRDVSLQTLAAAETLPLPLLWESGGIIGGSGEEVAANTYARTAGFIPHLSGVKITLTPKNGARVYLHTWENDSYKKQDSGLTTMDFITADSCSYRIVVNDPTNNTAVTPKNIGSYLDAYMHSNLVSTKNMGLFIDSVTPKLSNKGGFMNVDTGALYVHSDCAFSDPVSLYGYDTIVYTTFLSNAGACVAFYDDGMDYLKDISISGTTELATIIEGKIDLTAPEYAAASYVVFSSYVGGNNEKGDIFKAKIYKDGSSAEKINPLLGKVVNVMGDSITSTDFTRPTWWEIIAADTGAIFNNYGQSGTTLAHTDDRHDWDFSFKKDTLPEYNPANPSTWESGNCFCERVDEMDTNADAVVIMGGTNDGSVPRGPWNGGGTNTFFGALDTLMQRLLTTFAGKPIIFCTMMQAKDNYTSNVADPLSALMSKSDGDTLSIQLRAEAIKAKCRQYGLPCVDLFNESGITGADGGIYYNTSDTLHPSAQGQKRIANMVENALNVHLKY